MRTLVLVLVQIAVPAPVYFAIAIAERHTVSAVDLQGFAPNYAFMAAPHIVIALAAGIFAARRRRVVSNLVVVNLTLIGFATWLVLRVPARESGLAWILYPPIAALALAVAFLVRLYHAKSSTTTVTAPR